MKNRQFVEGEYVREKPIFMTDPVFYGSIPGIFTYRGNNFRNCASYGYTNIYRGALTQRWEFRGIGKKLASTQNFEWSGVRWTGQPLVAEWPLETRAHMNLTDFAKRRYAGNPRFLADDLKALGFTARLSPMMIDKLRELFAFPWPVDVQLDLLDDGSVGDVLGISLCTGNMGRDALLASLEHGDLRELMRLLESYGVSDARWKKLGNTVFQVLALLHSDDGNKCRYILSGNLGFVKVRFQGTGALAMDAKVYLNLRAVRFGKDDG